MNIRPAPGVRPPNHCALQHHGLTIPQEGPPTGTHSLDPSGNKLSLTNSISLTPAIPALTERPAQWLHGAALTNCLRKIPHPAASFRSSSGVQPSSMSMSHSTLSSSAALGSNAGPDTLAIPSKLPCCCTAHAQHQHPKSHTIMSAVSQTALKLTERYPVLTTAASSKTWNHK